MVLNDYTKHIMAEYIKDMFDAGLILRYGAYSEAGNVINRRLRGRGFCDFFENCPLNLTEATTIEEIVSRLDDANVWVSNSVDGRNGTWYWHTRLPAMDDDKFLELINTNRKLYRLSESKYTQSEMAKAARLLDDEMQYEI